MAIQGAIRQLENYICFSCSANEQKRRGLSPMVVSSGSAKSTEAS